jgi:DNA-binding NtrC family response regulator
MTATPSILTISRDQSLQNTRTIILEQAGYTVSAALNDKDAVGFVEAINTLNLVLMCHSVPEASRISLVTRIKELRPKLPILMLYNGYDPTEAKVDGSLHSLETPEAMLDMIGFMTRNIGEPIACNKAREMKNPPQRLICPHEDNDPYHQQSNTQTQ